MQFHSLQRNTPRKKKKYVGRGGKRGKTAGRGTKGQNARAGRKKRPEMRDIIKKLPKLRGRGIGGLYSIAEKPFVVNLSRIESLVKNGDVVTPGLLVSLGVTTMTKGRNPKIKILGDGEINKKITVKDCQISESAKEKVIKAGGKVQ